MNSYCSLVSRAVGEPMAGTAVQFLDNHTGQTHQIRLRPNAEPIQIQPSCGQSTPKAVSTYQFLTHTIQ
ncbi:MAG: hypothetical protein P8183_13990 [Anaerolineae bacterium]